MTLTRFPGLLAQGHTIPQRPPGVLLSCSSTATLKWAQTSTKDDTDQSAIHNDIKRTLIAIQIHDNDGM